jgi:hypothetical protein
MPATTSATSTAPNSTSALADAHDERRQLAARALGDALLLGIVGDALLRVPSWGANMTVWSVAIVLAMITLARRRSDALPADARWLLLPAIALSLMFVWRDADSLAAYNTLALIGTFGLLSAAIAGGPRPSLGESRVRDIAQSAVTVGFSTAFGMLPLVLSDVSFRQVAGERGTSRAITALRAGLVAIPLLLVFGSLFASADPVFAHIVGDLFQIDAETVASHCAVSGIIAWLVGGLLRATVLSGNRTTRTIPFPDGALGLTEVSVALGSLVFLFAAFVAVQLRYFFGGNALVQATAGMSYAEYARRGFFELVTVSALVLPVLLSANALLRRDTPRVDRVFRVLAGTLIVLLAVIMYSAVARMRLYQSIYGLTTDRLYATVFMGWLAIVFAWFAATVLRGRDKRFTIGVLVSGWGTLVALNVADPAGYVAHFNVARAAQRKDVDVQYMASLGGDAVPTLVGYLVRQPRTAPAGWVAPRTDSATADVSAQAAVVPPASSAAPNATPVTPVQPANGRDDFTQRCLAARRLLSNWSSSTTNDWRSWTFARARARRAVAANDAALREIAGSEWLGPRPVGCPAPPA